MTGINPVKSDERLKWEAWACLKDLGVDMSYDEFCNWLKGQIGDRKIETGEVK